MTNSRGVDTSLKIFYNFGEMVKLGVNVDHVATLRQARRIEEPDPVYAAYIAEQAGADQITVHLREDRRHIQERDIFLLKQTIKTRLNLEMSINEEIVKIALELLPHEVCLVPERRQEITTEGGLNVIQFKDEIREVVDRLKEKNIVVSLFIEPDEKQIEMSKKVGADAVEIHTGKYANAKFGSEQFNELKRIEKAARFVSELGLILNAGHGLNYKNIPPIAKIPNMNTLNIGFSIIARAVFVGLYQAVKEMKDLIISSTK